MIVDTPLIFDIAKGSFVDGPGVRTVIFLKACPLRCVWCHNPESQDPNPEIFHFPEECIDCGNCQVGKDCYTGARKIVGKYYSPSELIQIILRDKPYYDTSGGGVTFSGGEPGIFADYLRTISTQLKKENIHIAIQTCGYFNYQNFEVKLLPYIDLIYFDIKIFDPKKHEEYTGRSNELILKNFEKLCDSGVDIIPRIPLIPTYTATKENLGQIVDFLRSHKINSIETLSYNPSGIDKLKRLGKEVSEEILIAPLSMKEEKYWHNFLLNN